MATKLGIPPCCSEPPHPTHPPRPDRPLRVEILGDIEPLQAVLPELSSLKTGVTDEDMTQDPPEGTKERLANLVYEKLYRSAAGPGDVVVRGDYFLYSKSSVTGTELISYGVFFDHLVPANGPNPEVLVLNIINVDDVQAALKEEFARTVDKHEYEGKKLLIVPRCCQKRRGTTDRTRVNDMVLAKGNPDSVSSQ